MGPVLQFDLLQSLSLNGAPQRANDDRIGADGTRAWVIDGATDLATPGLMGSQGGAAWLASALNTGFAGASGADMAASCAEVFAQIETRFDQDRLRDPVAAWELPKAAFAAVQLTGATLQCAWSADCSVLLGTPKGTRWCTPEPDSHAEVQVARALGAGAELSPEILADRRAHRARPDHEAIRPDAKGSHAATTYSETKASPGDHVLMMSDGLSALVSDYGRYDGDGLMQAALTHGLAALAAKLRQIEAEDADCTRYPRFKISDDASAILLRINR